MDATLTQVKMELDAMQQMYADGAHQMADELLLQLLEVLANRLGVDVKPIIESYKRVPKWFA